MLQLSDIAIVGTLKTFCLKRKLCESHEVYLKVIAAGVVGTPKERCRCHAFIISALVDFLLLRA